MPFQINYDDDLGSTETGERYRLNIQPAIPVQVNAQWNVISRTIVPLVNHHQHHDSRTDASYFPEVATGGLC